MRYGKLENIHRRSFIGRFLVPDDIRLRCQTILKFLNRISEIIKGRRRITADTALRLSNYFGNSAKFWMGLQDDYDLKRLLSEKNEVFNLLKDIELTQPNELATATKPTLVMLSEVSFSAGGCRPSVGGNFTNRKICTKEIKIVVKFYKHFKDL